MASTYPFPPKRWIKTWKGNENLRDCIAAIAREIVRTDAIIRKQYPSSVATGLIMDAMVKKTLPASVDVQTAASAQNKLHELVHEAVWTHHLEIDFVGKVWRPILDPNLA